MAAACSPSRRACCSMSRRRSRTPADGLVDLRAGVAVHGKAHLALDLRLRPVEAVPDTAIDLAIAIAMASSAFRNSREELIARADSRSASCMARVDARSISRMAASSPRPPSDSSSRDASVAGVSAADGRSSSGADGGIASCGSGPDTGWSGMTAASAASDRGGNMQTAPPIHPATPADATRMAVSESTTQPDAASRAGGRTPSSRRTRDSSDPLLAAIAMPIRS